MERRRELLGAFAREFFGKSWAFVPARLNRRWFRIAVRTLALVTVSIVVKISVPISVGSIHLGGRQAIVNLYGKNVPVDKIIVEIPNAPAGQSPEAPATTPERIVENGGFERGVDGWGTGWFEDHLIHSGVLALGFGGAKARWSPDDRHVHSGRSSLRVEHLSPLGDNVFSSFNQRIKVRPWHQYEVKFWAYLEASDRKSFSLRVLPSRVIIPEEWGRFKVRLNSDLIGQWQPIRLVFDSKADWFVDLRFMAEAVMTAWVDDVSVSPLAAADR